MQATRRLAWVLGFALVLVYQPISSAQNTLPITVTDDFNRTVTLPKPAERILSLAPHITENLFSAAAGDKIIGVAAHSDYPPAARHIASVGSSYARINLEAVIKMAPDLVVAWQTGGNRDTLKKIADLGFPVYYSEPRDFHSIVENIQELALLAGRGKHIAPLVAQLRAELAGLSVSFSRQSQQTVFYQIWGEPLMTLGGTHIISRVLELCGARNAFAHLSLIAPRISVESVVQANPDIIITSQVDGQRTDISRWKKWSSLSAVQHDGFVFVDASAMHRHTARMIMSIRNLCEQIDRVRKRQDG